ncbi:ATP synthase subunit I [Clostridium sp. 'deep sea']|uniref:ATP synthase subunit I n=1 Tax=Clostridium sp. 'deep sea' TaxID=2779445 RepID=UPI00189648A6|nr:ATP synthase subunit I [Clostridium sp. 'deep sea']QOR33784.1 ATP synthase subunit I [Clostridium sp. 'deep sea']
MNDSPHELRKSIEKTVLMIVAVISLLSLISGQSSFMWGIIVGGLCSLMHFRTICMIAERVIDTDKRKARLSTVVGYSARYIVNAGILAYSYFLPTLSFLGVIIGLLLVKIVIITRTLRDQWKDVLSSQLKNIKNKFERRE